MTLVASELPTPADAASVVPVAGTRTPGTTITAISFAGRPGGLAVGPDGTRFVSDATTGTIWRITRVGETTAVARRFGSPAGLAMAPDGTLFVADTTGHRVWAVSSDGHLRVVAGGGYGYRDGPGQDALFRYPSDVAIAPDGTCYVADGGNHRVRTISPDGLVATLAGSIFDYGDGLGPDGRFRQPLGLDVGPDGTCYVADTGNNAIRHITTDGEVTTLAGSPPGGDRDGAGGEVGLRSPTAIAVGPDGDLFVVDHGNAAVRRIDPAGSSTTCVRLSDRHWPVAVALSPDSEVVVAAVALDDPRSPEARLITLGADP
ncbi:MAG: SMP-30/gluconolactonase/LRE family protein [Acidimicrobiales bacterium]